MFDRAQARDFLDVRALIGRFGLERMCHLTSEKDRGFSGAVLVEMLGSFDRFTADELGIDEPDRRCGGRQPGDHLLVETHRHSAVLSQTTEPTVYLQIVGLNAAVAARRGPTLCRWITERSERGMATRKQRGDGELEAAVMDDLWDRGGWVTAGEVHESLATSRPIAYNTVLTILFRLCEKARLERQRDGRAYVYRPLQTREDYAATRMERVLHETRDRPAALASFLQVLDASDRAQLRRLLGQRTTRH